MLVSIPIFILAIIVGIFCLWMGFRIKGNQAVFGRVLSTNSQTWARFLADCWVGYYYHRGLLSFIHDHFTFLFNHVKKRKFIFF